MCRYLRWAPFRGGPLRGHSLGGTRRRRRRTDGSGGHPGSRPEGRSQLRVSVGLAPTSPVPGGVAAETVHDLRADGDRSAGHGRPLVDRIVNHRRRRRPRDACGILLPSTSVPRLHAVTWLVWAIAAMVIVQLAPSPLYVALILASSALVTAAHRVELHAGPSASWSGPGSCSPLIRVVLTALTTHGGRRPSCSRSPRSPCPDAGRLHRRRHHRDGGRPPGLVEGFAIVGSWGCSGRSTASCPTTSCGQARPGPSTSAASWSTVAAAFVPSTVTSWHDGPRGRPGPHRGHRAASRAPGPHGHPRAGDRDGAVAALWRTRWTPGASPVTRRGRRTPRRPGAPLPGPAGPRGAVRRAGRAPDRAGHGPGHRPASLLLVGAVVLASKASPRQRYRPRRLTRDDALVLATTGLGLALVAGAVGRRRGHPALVGQPSRGPRPGTRPHRAGSSPSPCPRCVPTRPDPVEAHRRPRRGPRGDLVTAVVTFDGVAVRLPRRRPTRSSTSTVGGPAGDVAARRRRRRARARARCCAPSTGWCPTPAAGASPGRWSPCRRATPGTTRPASWPTSSASSHQDPEAQFVVDRGGARHRVRAREPGHGPDAAMRRRVEEVARRPRHRPPARPLPDHAVRRRAPAGAVAGALAAAPEVLVLDEPTASSTRRAPTTCSPRSARLNDDLGTTVLLAEHRLERAAPLADRAVRIDDGRLGAAAGSGPVLADLRRRAAGHPPRAPARLGPAAAHGARRPALGAGDTTLPDRPGSTDADPDGRRDRC